MKTQLFSIARDAVVFLRGLSKDLNFPSDSLIVQTILEEIRSLCRGYSEMIDIRETFSLDEFSEIIKKKVLYLRAFSSEFGTF